MKRMVVKSIIVLFLIANGLLFSYIYFVNTCMEMSQTMEYVAVEPKISLEYEPYSTDMTRAEIRERMERIVGVCLYDERFEAIADKGNVNTFSRVIRINKDIEITDYIWVLCHEMVHLKYYSHCERFTSYKTFVLLYNSEFRPMAINLACSMRDGGFEQEYNCYAQIEEYLINRGYPVNI